MNDTSGDDNRGKEAAKAAASAVVGGVTGYGVIAATGLTAAGMIGGGAGVGMASTVFSKDK